MRFLAEQERSMTVRRRLRRQFLSSMLTAGAACLFPGGRALAAAEPLPVFKSDIHAVPYRFRRREVDFDTEEPAGTIIVDSRKRHLYFVLGEGRAIRYGVGVGDKEAAWSGTAIIKRKAKWPTWTPTPEQRAKHKIYAKYAKGMPGSSKNPLGARAMYLFQNDQDTLYRIHGTPDPSSIGKVVSSGCIRMINVDIVELYEQTKIGTRVVVLNSP